MNSVFIRKLLLIVVRGFIIHALIFLVKLFRYKKTCCEAGLYFMIAQIYNPCFIFCVCSCIANLRDRVLEE